MRYPRLQPRILVCHFFA
jgi:hypothetical protein